MIKSVWKFINNIAISHKRGMEQAQIIDTFWTYHRGVPTAHYKAPHARPSLSVSTHHRQPFYDLVPRDPKRQVPLANNEQIRVAPGESTPNPKAGHALGSDSSVSTGFGLPVSSLMRPGPRRSKVDQQGNHVSAGPGCFKRYLPGATRQAYMHGFQMVNQLGPPQKCLKVDR